ncbi:ubiA prenyltransferase domain-containing protein 1 homolog [Argiope bruennichi]|uniref:ubiA prenyltransferase domain-containing protein 1 homolog n=1 Tax=Argiope bruennichi TaxID=94029 RepID=UPI00249495DC|nr:ubiA prenyltransferase domain-containing protein 1 homolog [Argiope bruennichi]XP_055939036.1 ubiA prenyltransferase domain-containing protein 1 homolog [Argiope bruennichi]XP_055939037.1 ubiA prenyltransferase domain-containing protein 1 homolog [Argiope bruennichi]
MPSVHHQQNSEVQEQGDAPNHQNDTHNAVNIQSSKLSTFSTYVHALRPWSFSASLMPVAIGAVLAYKTTEQFDFIIFFITCLTAVSVHAAGNVVNTYFDYMKGIDSRRSDDRTLVDKILTPDEIVHLGVILYTLGCCGFIGIVLLSTAKMEHLALVYFGGLSSSFLYTGGIGLKYIAMGDVLIIVTFGPLSVLFSFMAQTGYMDFYTLFYAMPLALNTEAILHSNNTRDMENDHRAGVVTLAILFGYAGSHILYAVLLFFPYIFFSILGLQYSLCFLLPLITLPTAFKLEKMFRDRTLQKVPKETAKLNVSFGLFYLLACMMTNKDKFPYLGVI